TSTRNINTASYGGRPPLVRSDRPSARSSSERDNSKSTTAASRSSGAPAPESHANPSSLSKNPPRPAIAHPPHPQQHGISHHPRLPAVFRGVRLRRPPLPHSQLRASHKRGRARGLADRPCEALGNRRAVPSGVSTDGRTSTAPAERAAECLGHSD